PGCAQSTTAVSDQLIIGAPVIRASCTPMPSMKFDIRSLSLIAAVATAYFLAGELAIALSPEVSGGVPRLIMWPAGGIALAAIWRFGLPALIGSAIGAWLGGLLISGNIWLAALGAAATLT